MNTPPIPDGFAAEGTPVIPDTLFPGAYAK
jgi:hypothetical protein